MHNVNVTNSNSSSTVRLLATMVAKVSVCLDRWTLKRILWNQLPRQLSSSMELSKIKSYSLVFWTCRRCGLADSWHSLKLSLLYREKMTCLSFCFISFLHGFQFPGSPLFRLWDSQRLTATGASSPLVVPRFWSMMPRLLTCTELHHQLSWFSDLHMIGFLGHHNHELIPRLFVFTEEP